MDFTEVLQNPIFWGSLIMLPYPRVFDLFEQLLQWLGVASVFDTPTRKTILAWAFAFPVSLGALWVLSLVWPDAHEFAFDEAMLLGTAIVTIVTSTFTLPSFKNRGLLFSTSHRVTNLATNYKAWQERRAA